MRIVLYVLEVLGGIKMQVQRTSDMSFQSKMKVIGTAEQQKEVAKHVKSGIQMLNLPSWTKVLTPKTSDSFEKETRIIANGQHADNLKRGIGIRSKTQTYSAGELLYAIAKGNFNYKTLRINLSAIKKVAA